MPAAQESFDVAFFNGERSLTRQVAEYFADQQAKRRTGPWQVRLSSRLTRAESWEAMNLDTGPRKFATVFADNMRPEAAIPLVEAVGEKIRDRYGSLPSCQVRLRIYHQGESNRTDRNFVWERHISPDYDGDAGGGYAPQAGMGMIPIEMFLASNAQKDQTLLMAMQELRAAFTTSQTLVSEQSAQLAATATVRAVGAASADTGGLWQIVSLVGFAVAFPMIKDMLGMPSGATLPDMMKAFKLKMDNMIKVGTEEGLHRDADLLQAGAHFEATQHHLRGQPPVGELPMYESLEEEPGEYQSEASRAVIPGARALNARDVIALARQDPKFLEDVISSVMQDDKLKDEASLIVIRNS